MENKNIGIFINGCENYNDGCSSLNNLLNKVNIGEFKVQVQAIISNNWNGGARKESYDSGITFERMKYFSDISEKGEYNTEQIEFIKELYQNIINKYGLDYIFLISWDKYISGLLANKSINTYLGNDNKIYKGKTEKEIYREIYLDFKSGNINNISLNVSFLNQDNSIGPLISQLTIALDGINNIYDLKNKILKVENDNLWKIYQSIVSSDISWSGNEDDEISINYEKLKKLDLSNDIIIGSNK